MAGPRSNVTSTYGMFLGKIAWEGKKIQSLVWELPSLQNCWVWSFILYVPNTRRDLRECCVQSLHLTGDIHGDPGPWSYLCEASRWHWQDLGAVDWFCSNILWFIHLILAERPRSNSSFVHSAGISSALCLTRHLAGEMAWKVNKKWLWVVQEIET